MNLKLRYADTVGGEQRVLGPLEAEIMEVCWQDQHSTVKKIHRILSGRREVAYTTVMTAMTRLATKGILKRDRKGMAYVYTPAIARDEFGIMVVQRMTDSLLDEYGAAGAAAIRECLARRGALVEQANG